MVGDKGENLLEYVFGNVFDVLVLIFSDGSQFVIELCDGKGDMVEVVQVVICGVVCLYFIMVLGFGVNVVYDDYLYLDIKVCDSGWWLCQ